MTRNAFHTVTAVSLDRLLLDTKNPRIRAGVDQADSMERLLRKPKQLLALARDIAAEGLSTAPILVEPVKGKKYVVWDGNRRITALKILNDPELCRNKAIRAQFVAIAAKAKAELPTAVDVMASTNKQALVKEVIARHAGGLEGAGQLNWDALLRTMFLLGHQAPADYRLAGHLLMWAEEHGIPVDDDFPITTIHRFLNKKNLARLGFNSSDDGVTPTIAQDVAVRLVERLVQDFGPGGGMGVAHVFEGAQQDAYIGSLAVEFGLEPPPADASSTGKNGGGGADGDSSGDSSGAGDKADTGDGAGSSAGKRGSSTRAKPTRGGPTKPDWDRKGIVRSSFKPVIPEKAWKAEQVLRELRRLETEKHSISTAALFRVFFELSTKHYMRRHQVGDTGNMSKNGLAVATNMRQHGRLDQGEHDAVSRRLKDKSQAGERALTYDTLNDYLHSFKALPDRQSLHVLWREVEAYLDACWDDARRPH